jgi:phosphoribosylglycinamide formyltransferase-1
MASGPSRLNVSFLASHNGTNMRAIVAACRAGTLDVAPTILVSNNADCGAMTWARQNDIPTFHISATSEGSEAAADAAIATALRHNKTDLVVMAGYMRKLGPKTLQEFANRILNVHPALLPKHGGKGMYGKFVHEAVLKSGDVETGATIHLVDGEYDHGPRVVQERVDIQPGDNVQTLTARVQAKEQELFPETLRRIVNGEIDLDRL